MSIATDLTPQQLIAELYKTHRGEMADAEPAVPEWTFAVDELFD
jgi:hypothetical protein